MILHVFVSSIAESGQQGFPVWSILG